MRDGDAGCDVTAQIQECAVGSATLNGERVRARVMIRGVVQGVGFRPFVFRLARDLGLGGWVSNSCQGVTIEVEGGRERLGRFLERLTAERPAHSCIQTLETTWLDAAGGEGFEIRRSEVEGVHEALVLPDLATCDDCLREIRDPGDRRYQYPFTNCTHCGPRFSIVRSIPYDRPNTSMAGFSMCPACQAEYEAPGDRRFHAQPNACPVCGPHVEFWDGEGQVRSEREEALEAAVRVIREGGVVAVKGVGGFHLVVRAADELAVRRLRARKGREAKPLALMFPSLAMVEAACEVSGLEANALGCSAAPIVLLRRRREGGGMGVEIAGSVAPGNPYLGAMLPYTPLHHLLMAKLGEPVVATSGNRSDEPICTDEGEGVRRLGGIADTFLVHNRPIVRPVDDSVIRVVLGREQVMRRARGYAPLPVLVTEPLRTVLAVGGHLKNTVALGRGRQVFVSQHLGDLETPAAMDAFRRACEDLQDLFGARAPMRAADLHPDYGSTREAHRNGCPVVCVQHHYAHVVSCMAENDASAPLLGVSWDGTGLGTDETIWGGEFLRVTERSFERVGHLRSFRLPGGDKAVMEPRRAGLGLLHALMGARAFELGHVATLRAFKPAELEGLRRMLETGFQAPVTTSAGRLFDAVASLAGLRQMVRMEGQAAMDLEFALDRDESDAVYPIAVREDRGRAKRDGRGGPDCAAVRECTLFPRAAGCRVLDWGPMVEQILMDLELQVPVWEISARFHNTLAEGILRMAQTVGERRVALTGGCFQNRYLLEQTVQRLRSDGFSPYWHQRVPTHDGGISLGQAVVAGRDVTREVL